MDEPLNELTFPVVYVDAGGRLVIVGFAAWNNAAFVDAGRAFPDSWTKLIPERRIK